MGFQAAGFGVSPCASVDGPPRHHQAGWAAAATRPSKARECRPGMHVYLEAKVAALERDSRIEVIDDVPDADALHGSLQSEQFVEADHKPVEAHYRPRCRDHTGHVRVAAGAILANSQRLTDGAEDHLLV